MTYSTELPEGFKTWNELKKKCERSANGDFMYWDILLNEWLYFYENDLKAECYDEIMELMGRAYDWEIPTEDQESDFVSDLEQLTHTKLFK